MFSLYSSSRVDRESGVLMSSVSVGNGALVFLICFLWRQGCNALGNIDNKKWCLDFGGDLRNEGEVGLKRNKSVFFFYL